VIEHTAAPSRSSRVGLFRTMPSMPPPNSPGASRSGSSSPPLKGEADGAGVRHVAIERLDDGGLQLGGAVAIQQP
jgi:hypothetical protein